MATIRQRLEAIRWRLFEAKVSPQVMTELKALIETNFGTGFTKPSGVTRIGDMEISDATHVDPAGGTAFAPPTTGALLNPAVGPPNPNRLSNTNPTVFAPGAAGRF